MLKTWRGGRVYLNDSESYRNAESKRYEGKGPVREDHFKNHCTKWFLKLKNC